MAQLSCGIVGLPNVGKSTLFNALTQAGAEVAPYPFCTIDPNVGVIPVKDERLDRVTELVDVKNTIYHTVEYVDVAGLVKNASQGEGRGNEFLEHVRSCHALIQVVRCFEDEDVAHVSGTLDPIDDIRTINMELLLADMQTTERALTRLRKLAIREADAKKAVAVLEKVEAHLNEEKPLRTLGLTDNDLEAIKEIRFVTDKKILYVANVGESDLPEMATDAVDAVRGFAEAEGAVAIPICAKLEAELTSLEPDEAAMFLEDMGLTETGLQRMARATSDLLGLVSFFTFNDSETRAWKIPSGTRAQDAAGVIHTDFADKFIKAEVTAFADFDTSGSMHHAKEKGLVRTEGRDYIVQDGDVIYFKLGP